MSVTSPWRMEQPHVFWRTRASSTSSRQIATMSQSFVLRLLNKQRPTLPPQGLMTTRGRFVAGARPLH